MIRYTKYDSDTGNIEYSFDGHPNDILANEPCIQGEYSAEEYRIVNGLAVRKTDLEIETQNLDTAWILLRRHRDNLLKDSDWTQVPDAPVNTNNWATYRQTLRDLPSNTTDPNNVVWPSTPN